MDSSRLSISSDDSNGSDNQRIATYDSTSALILVHDEDAGGTSTPFDYTTDDSEDDEAQDSLDANRYSEPLTSTTVFLYLLAPCLKLGALLLPNSGLPLKFGLPSLFLFGVLSAFVRQIWYMLARYLRRGELEDVVVEVFTKGNRNRERKRLAVRATVRLGTWVLRLLTITLYLRESIRTLAPVFSEQLDLFSAPLMTIAASLVILPICISPSLSSKRAIYATWMSVLTYLVWLTCVSVAQRRGQLYTNPAWLRMGSLWEGITTIAFAFTSTSTLPLYASLRAGMSPSHTTGSGHTSAANSFRLLSSISVAIVILLTFPLAMFAASPKSSSSDMESALRLEHLIAIVHTLTLLLGIPFLSITAPPLPFPESVRRVTPVFFSKVVTLTIATILSLVPVNVSSVLSDVLLVSTLLSTYVLPAVVHLTAHIFRRPRSILIPPTPNPRDAIPPSESAQDELLQRKERSLQRRQLRKRIIWDIGIWALVLPVGGGGVVWAIGRLAGKF